MLLKNGENTNLDTQPNGVVDIEEEQKYWLVKAIWFALVAGVIGKNY